MMSMLKIGRTLQLHNPTVLAEVYADIESHLPVEGTAMFHPPSGSIVIRCAEHTYLSVPQVRLIIAIPHTSGCSLQIYDRSGSRTVIY